MRKIVYTFLIGLVLGTIGGFYISNKTKPNIYIPTVTKEYIDGREIVKYIYKKLDPSEIVKKNISNEIKKDIDNIVKNKNNTKIFYPKIYYTGKIGLGLSLIRFYKIDLDTFLTYSKKDKVNLYGNLGFSYHLPFARMSNTSIGICKEINIENTNEQNYRLYLAINF